MEWSLEGEGGIKEDLLLFLDEHVTACLPDDGDEPREKRGEKSWEGEGGWDLVACERGDTEEEIRWE